MPEAGTALPRLGQKLATEAIQFAEMALFRQVCGRLLEVRPFYNKSFVRRGLFGLEASRQNMDSSFTRMRFAQAGVCFAFMASFQS